MSDRILVRGVNWIGDAVMMIPALWSVRRAYRESSIGLLVKPSVAPLFERDPHIDDIILYEDRFATMFGRLRLSWELRRMHFSKAILFQNAFDAAVIAFLSGIPERVGYARDGRTSLLTHAVPYDREDRKFHHTEYYLHLLRSSGMPAEFSHPWLYLSLEERLEAREKLSGLARPILGINPGATYGSAKRWFPERFAEVANWFVKDTGGSVVLFGGTGEVGIAQEIDKHITGSKLLLAGKTSLRELIALIAESDVLVTNDSGPMHIGYAVRTPLVAIFGSTSPELTGPLGTGTVVLDSRFDCGPCFERTCRTGDMRCMYVIGAEEVYLAVKKVLPDKRAVFFDRDGTLCRDAGYLRKEEDLDLLPGLDRLAELKQGGMKLIGISNQSGIARGMVEESFVKHVNRLFIEKYGFDDFFYCPHHPDDHCLCRKPEPGMVYEARDRHGIDLRESYMVGDKESDMELAKAAGMKGILVRTGHDRASQRADFIVGDLDEALRVIRTSLDAR